MRKQLKNCCYRKFGEIFAALGLFAAVAAVRRPDGLQFSCQSIGLPGWGVEPRLGFRVSLERRDEKINVFFCAASRLDIHIESFEVFSNPEMSLKRGSVKPSFSVAHGVV